MQSNSPSTPKRRTMKDWKTPKKRRIFPTSPHSSKIIKMDEKIVYSTKIEDFIQSFSRDLPPQMDKEDHSLILLHVYLGFQTLVILLSALHHVPKLFPNRLFYIMNIVNRAACRLFSLEDIIALVTVIDSCAATSAFLQSNMLDMADILWKTSMDQKEPYLKFLVPPVTRCLDKNCSGTVYPFSKTWITVFTTTGPLPGQKAVLRCRECKTYYHIDGYHVANKGKQLYPADICQEWKTASNKVYFSTDLHEFMCESGNHAFVSHQAFAEIYNSVFSESHHLTLKFYNWKDAMQQTAEKDFLQINTESDEDDLTVLAINDEDVTYFDEDKDLYLEEEISSCGTQISMTRKNTAAAYFNGELQNEIWDRNLSDQIFFNKETTRETVMKIIDQDRKCELYKHGPDDCSAYCKSKGCQNLHVIDSCWKVCMCHCMFAVPMEVDGYPLLSFPNVCTNEPKVGSVFCTEHFDLLTRHSIPTSKEDFLKFIGCSSRPKSQAEIQKVDDRLVEFANNLYAKDELAQQLGASALDCQGTDDLVAKMTYDTWQDETKEEELCNKDTGIKSRLRQRSRGHFVCVTGGGHITYFDPIFKSENPTQIFMQVIRLMYLELKDVPVDQLDEAIENYILCYDNMCHLDALKCSKVDLPLPEPYDKMWHRIKKIVDRLHLVNHKNSECKIKYNPDDVLPDGYNTMVAEQTFAWFSRFKKIANSMSQSHHLFYIHRNIKRRNKYTTKCRKKGKNPVLPGINTNLTKQS